MHIVLVNPPNGLYDAADLAPPLGLLTLASPIRAAGHSVTVLDFNLEVMENHLRDGPGFLDYATQRIRALRPDIVGFTSMCVESHVCIMLAGRLKELEPTTITVFGGVHFSSVAAQLVEHFQFIDYVVIGEAEHSFLQLVIQLSAGLKPENHIVLSKRAFEHPDGELPEIGFPAYECVDLPRYFALNARQLICYEGGRGCIFNCAFCYSPAHYGRSIRTRIPSQIVADLKRLAQLGAKHIFFVQDNLLNSRSWAIDLLRELKVAKLDLSWSCYATWPQLDNEVIDGLASAGCTGIFTGIDAVAPSAQRRLRKAFLKDWSAAEAKLRYAVGKGVIPTCAFILEGPTQNPSEIESALATALACRQIGCEIRINTLTIYNNTSLEEQYRARPRSYSETKVALLLDTPEVVRENPLANAYPVLFPYHSTPFGTDEWDVFVAKSHAAFTSIYFFAGFLSGLTQHHGGNIWNLFAYVDVAYVQELITCHPLERRQLAIKKLADAIETLNLKRDLLDVFRFEYARALLSNAPPARKIVIVRNGLTEAFWLREFTRVDPSEEPFGTEFAAFAVRWTHTSIRRIWIPRPQSVIMDACRQASIDGATLAVEPADLDWLMDRQFVWSVVESGSESQNLPPISVESV